MVLQLSLHNNYVQNLLKTYLLQLLSITVNYCQIILILKLPAVVPTPLYVTPANFILSNPREWIKNKKLKKKLYSRNSRKKCTSGWKVPN